MTEPENPFAGFWMGGFEGADHVNGSGVALDMARLSGHWDRLDEDHRRARDAGIRCVRESIGWRLCEAPGGRIDLSRALRIADSAARHGLQVLWTVMHYGLPSDLSLHDDALVPRLARFAAACARALGPAVYTPVNEISFLAWCASQPGLFAPPNAAPAGDALHSRISGWTVKRRLAHAAIEAVKAMRAEQPAARFLHVDPLVHVVAPEPALEDEARAIAGWQWQGWDLVAGRLEPELGGHPSLLDLVGINHYHSSQWELGSEARLDWWARDPRRRPLASLLAEAWTRYGRPLVVAETSHVGVGRADWLHEIAHEARRAQHAGVPVQGLCLYPLVDRPDWHEPARWHKSGLWHVCEATRARHAEPAGRAALRDWQDEWQVAPRRDVLLMFAHRPWRGVRGRTHHLAERLARRGWRVVFVEPARPGEPRLDRFPAGPHLDVLVPHGEGDRADLAAWLRAEGIGAFTAWLATPAAWPLARALQPARVVYDCAFEPGSPRLEAELLAAADRVFAAGGSLATPRAAHWRRLRVLPNAADLRHFRRRRAGGWDHDEARALQPPGAPRLGHAGTIDERLDLGLVAALADARPHWQFVFAGPCVLDPARLPRRPNLHWLGPVPYRLLPELMAGWQLALLPWVRSAATRHAQPLQALEALAAGLPVVAPPLAELVRWRDAGVHFASSPAGFLRACDAALAAGGVPAAARRRLAAWTWDDAAARADALLRMPAAGGGISASSAA